MPRRFIASFAPHQFFRATFFRLSTVATLFAFFAMTGLVAYPTPALAACTNPAGAEGEMIYNDDFNVAQFCNGTSWVSMSGGASAGAESDPQVGATTLNKWCRGDGASVVCDLDAPLTTESDPKVGTLTGGKWCTTNGTVVECASDLPIGTLTSGKFCTTNGTTISCTTDAPTATAGADTQVIFNSGGTLTGDASFVWDNINKRLGIGTTGPTAPLDISTASTNSTYMHLTNTASSGRTWTLYSSGGGPAASGTFGIYDTTANSSRLSIDASGNVGIGTTTPGSRLYVEGSDAAYSASIVNTRGDASGNGLYVQTRWNVPTNYLARFTTNSGTQEVLAIKGDGNVGIGTTAPNAQLDAWGTGSIIRAYSAASDAQITAQSAGTINSALLTLTGRQTSSDSMWNIVSAGSGLSGGMLRFVNGAWTGTPSMVITNSGNVGIGTTAPNEKLHVVDTTAIVGNPTVRLEGGTAGWGAGIEAGAPLTGGSYLAMGKAVWDGESSWNTTVSTQDAYFRVFVTADGAQTERLRLSSAGVLTLSGYGAGTLTTNASGVVSVSSDERLKDVKGNFKRGLDAVRQIQPISYYWKEGSPMSDGVLHAGFGAQNVKAAIPEAVGVGRDGYLSLSDRPIIAALVNSVKQLKAENDALLSRIEKLESLTHTAISQSQ